MAAYTSIDDPGLFFNTLLYTGNDTSGLAITGVGFQPDFVWLKDRDSGSDELLVFDAVRGATKFLESNNTDTEETQAESLQSIDSDGYTNVDLSSINSNTNKHVTWNWKAGTTSGITTDGNTTITPSAYSFNQTSLFSIIKYTGKV